jgi:hypothetical protein
MYFFVFVSAAGRVVPYGTTSKTAMRYRCVTGVRDRGGCRYEAASLFRVCNEPWGC